MCPRIILSTRVEMNLEMVCMRIGLIFVTKLDENQNKYDIKRDFSLNDEQTAVLLLIN